MSSNASIDWDEAREVLRRTIRSKMDRSEPDLLEDLVQEGCVRLLRASRTTPVDDVVGLSITIAQRTWFDHLRRVSRHRARFSALEDDQAERIPDPSTLRDPLLGDLGERAGLIVQELLATPGHEECGKLARAFLARIDWKQVAETMSIGYAAVRKRWSRCLSQLRERFAGDPEWGALLGEG